jgi:hypothetical protein
MPPVTLLALVLAVSAHLGISPSPRVVAAIVAAVEAEREPVFGSAAKDATNLVIWCGGETGCVEHAIAGDHGISRGPWQLQGACGLLPVERHPACWLALAAWSLKLCRNRPDPERMSALASGSCARGHVVSRHRYELVAEAIRAVDPDDISPEQWAELP